MNLVEPSTSDHKMGKKKGKMRPKMIYKNNALHEAVESGTVAEVKALLSRRNGKELAMEQNEVSEDNVASFFSLFSVFLVALWSLCPRTRLASTWARHRTIDGDIACVVGAAYGDLPVHSGARVTVMVSLQALKIASGLGIGMKPTPHPFLTPPTLPS